MTLPVWKDAACTTTFGSTAASTVEAASDADRSTSCEVKRAGRPNSAARALPAVRSQSRRSRLRPAITTVTGSDAVAARSSAIRPAKLPVPKMRMSARCVGHGGRCTSLSHDGRQRHAHDPQRRCDHRRRAGRDLDRLFPAQARPHRFGHRERRGRQPGERRKFRQCSAGRASSDGVSARAARHRAMGAYRGADRRAL